MKLKAAALIMVGVGVGAATEPNLNVYRGTARILVISAPSATDPRLARQDALFRTRVAELREREVRTVRVVGPHAQDDQGLELDAAAVRREVSASPAAFSAALIGKDGGVKIRRAAPVGPRELFSAIDAMPMRQAEMRRRAR